MHQHHRPPRLCTGIPRMPVAPDDLNMPPPTWASACLQPLTSWVSTLRWYILTSVPYNFTPTPPPPPHAHTHVRSCVFSTGSRTCVYGWLARVTPKHCGSDAAKRGGGVAHTKAATNGHRGCNCDCFVCVFACSHACMDCVGCMAGNSTFRSRTGAVTRTTATRKPW